MQMVVIVADMILPLDASKSQLRQIRSLSVFHPSRSNVHSISHILTLSFFTISTLWSWDSRDTSEGQLRCIAVRDLYGWLSRETLVLAGLEGQRITFRLYLLPLLCDSLIPGLHVSGVQEKETVDETVHDHYTLLRLDSHRLLESHNLLHGIHLTQLNPTTLLRPGRPYPNANSRVNIPILMRYNGVDSLPNSDLALLPTLNPPSISLPTMTLHSNRSPK